MKKYALLILILLCLVPVGYPVLKARQYHVRIQPADVQRIDLLQSEGAGYQAAPAGDIPQVVAWFNAGTFRGDNDSLAGPGCGAINLVIFLHSGQRVGLFDYGGGKIEVSQNGKHYFLEQAQLLDYIRRRPHGGC